MQTQVNCSSDVLDYYKQLPEFAAREAIERLFDLTLVSVQMQCSHSLRKPKINSQTLFAAAKLDVLWN